MVKPHVFAAVGFAILLMTACANNVTKPKLSLY